MPSPFPGMDPYLEHPAIWPDVHASLITALRDALAPRLRPRYYVAVEERTYILEPPVFVGRPDLAVVRRQRAPAPTTALQPVAVAVAPLTVEVPIPEEVREAYIEVREVATGRVITVVEFLSPANKRPGRGRELYEEKRLLLLGTRTHLVEVDLLRAGEPMTVHGDGRNAHYRILVSRSNKRPLAELYAFSVRNRIPVFTLPLQKGDEEPEVDIGKLLREIYDRAGYDLRIDYRAEAEPPLEGEDAVWADEILRKAGSRPAKKEVSR